MKIGWVVVYYNTPEKVKSAVKKQISDVDSSITLYEIDNSVDNRGFGAGVNKGIRQALSDGCTVVVISNPDIDISQLRKSSLAEVLVGGADILGFALKESDRTYYGGEIDRRRMSGGLINVKRKTRNVDFVSGSLMVIKKKVFETIGLFAEDYFLYYEDVEFCYRARKNNFTVAIDSSIVYSHEGRSDENPKKDWYLASNRLRFALQHGGLKQLGWELLYAPRTIVDLTKGALKRSSFVKNFSTLNLSSILSKFLNFLLFLVLVRTFTVEQYGVYALVWAHVALLSPLLDLGTTTYSITQDPKKTGDEFSALYGLRLTVGLFGALATIGLGFLMHYSTQELFFIVLLSSTVFVNAISGSYLILASIKQKSYRAAIASLIFQVILTVLSIVVLLGGAQLQGVMITTAVGYGMYGVVLLFLLKQEHEILYDRFFIPKIWKSIISRSYIFILIGLFSGLYYRADIFLLTKMLGEKAVGIYSAGYKFYDALFFLASSYTIAAAPMLASLAQRSIDEVKKVMKRDIIGMGLIGLVISVVVFLCAPYVLAYIVHRSFADSTAILQIIIWGFPLVLVSTILLNILFVYKKALWVMGVFLFQLCLTIAGNTLLIPYYGVRASAGMTLVSEILNVVILGLLVLKLFKNFVGSNSDNPESYVIGLDGGALSARKDKRYGNYTFSTQLIDSLGEFGKHTYQIYRHPFPLWNVLWIPLRQLLQPTQVYLALNQAIPSYISGKVIAFSHGLSFMRYPQLYLDSYDKLKKQVDEMVKRAAVIIVSSERVKKEFEEYFDVLPRIEVLVFGTRHPRVLTGDSDPEWIPRQVRGDTTFGNDNHYFLFVGMDHPIKRIDMIINSFKQVRKTHPDIWLYLVGVDKKREDVKNTIKVFEFLDKEDLDDMYRKAVGLVTASLYESFNFPVLEAISHGVPVVGTPRAIIPELQKYVTVVEDTDLVVGMRNVLKNTKKIDRVSLEKEFSWEMYVKKLEAIIKSTEVPI